MRTLGCPPTIVMDLKVQLGPCQVSWRTSSAVSAAAATPTVGPLAASHPEATIATASR
jgi:hypothetical protein